MQSGYEPGAHVRLRATLTQSGLQLQGEAAVWAELTRPDGTQATLVFQHGEDGSYSAAFDTGKAGVYRLRVRARGRTRKGMPFARERTLTAAVWRGGDRDAETSAGGGDRLIDLINERDERLCSLLKCLFGQGGAFDAEFEKRMRALGLNLDHFRKCLEGHCSHHGKRRANQDG